jgi:DcuC family C4-dicarboxylate transporter
VTAPVLATLVIACAVAFVVKRYDVRLVLGLAAALLFIIAGAPHDYFAVVARQMVDDKTVVPICSAMGFAWVIKHTGADLHLVTLLLAPLRHVRALVVPGGVASGYVVNTAIVSQSSTAACVGPVLVPIVTGVGVHPIVAGAMLLLGASMGGELFNPGAVELVTLSGLSNETPQRMVAAIMPYNLLASSLALLSFWGMTLWRRRDASTAAVQRTEEQPVKVSPLRAVVPLVPLILIFGVPALVELPQQYEGPVSIAAAMLLGVGAAGLVTPRVIPELPKAFFEGAGFAYTHVISLIIVATAFAEGMKLTGLIEALVGLLSHWPSLLVVAAVVTPLLLAVTTGSGIAPAVAVMKVLVPAAAAIGVDPLKIGALIAVSAQLGRTASPAAAVVMMASTVSGQSSHLLLREVWKPLLIAAAALLCVAIVV